MQLLVWIIVCLCGLSRGAVAQDPKVVLITGASRGIGHATAELLAESGYCVYATIRDENGFDAPLGSKVHYTVLDVTDTPSIYRTVAMILEKEGRLDVLINNAGYALGGPVECLSIEEANEQMDVNFFGVIRTCQEVLPLMRKQKSGRIINISSEQGVYGLPFGSLYTASKAALESLSEAMSIEVLPWDIIVSIVEPGLVATEFTVKLGSRQVDGNPYEKINEKIASMVQEKRVPSERIQTPEEIAQFLKEVIEDPEPCLRYQTSKLAEETVSLSIKDLTGKEYSERMKSQVVEAYQEAWNARED